MDLKQCWGEKLNLLVTATLSLLIWKFLIRYDCAQIWFEFWKTVMEMFKVFLKYSFEKKFINFFWKLFILDVKKINLLVMCFFTKSDIIRFSDFQPVVRVPNGLLLNIFWSRRVSRDWNTNFFVTSKKSQGSKICYYYLFNTTFYISFPQPIIAQKCPYPWWIKYWVR